MTTFFEQQERARRNSKLLVVLMVLAVAAMGGAFYGVLALLESSTPVRLRDPELPPIATGPALLAYCVLGTALVVMVASLVRTWSLRGGGARVAEMLGGRLVSGNAQDALEKRLVNVVEEMAIASGVPVPQAFVLDDEQGINAFAAGFSLDDAAVAVTRGCLEKLTREELQGVIAHEFSHVLNGDMRLNVRLMGMVFGIMCIGLFGRFLMRLARTNSSRSFSVTSRKGNPGAVFFFVGLGVFLIGTLGELLGKLIKAGVSRQREFLADASAVQFTRNPLGISGALQKIGGYSRGAHVSASNAEEASHFFFGDIRTHWFSGSAFATHPPLHERIARIDPSFQGEFAKVPEHGIVEPDTLGFEDQAFSALAQSRPSAKGQRRSVGTLQPAWADAPSEVVAHVGVLDASTLDEGRRLLAALSPKLRDAAHQPFSACAIIYALLLSDNADVQRVQRDELDALVGSALHAETLRMLTDIRSLPRRDRLPLAELTAPALRELSREQRALLLRALQALIDADGSVSIFEHVLAETLRMGLSASGKKPPRARHRSLQAVARELELVLSLLAHAGDFDGQGAQAAFAAASARLGKLPISLLPPGPKLLPALGPALAALAALTPVHAARVVDACAHAALADRRISDDETTLLRAVCSALGAPLPALPA
jgi:Zn-dependent protease with chaperone function/uncharacterized tellurite resistance protein B-like protein